MMAGKRRIMIPILTSFLVVGALSAFQNCSNAQLERPEHVVTMESKGTTDMCLDNAFLGYTVESFYARNVNVIPWVGGFLADSDADGLPDQVEASVGFDPLNPRSRSGVLDRVCYNLGNNSNNCPGLPAACSSAPNLLGISECDIKALRLDMMFQHPVQGLDSDKDGMPDYFEILAGTSPAVYDSAQDPDHDNILNQEELQRGSNIFFSDANISPSNLMDVHSEKLSGDDAGTCAGEAWRFTINHVQYIPSQAYTVANPSGINVSHAAGDNVVVAVLKIRPKAGVSGNAKIYYQTFTVNLETTDLPLNAGFFQPAGEVKP